MPNEKKKSRTLIEDLPVSEQELTAEEMENVQGGKTFFESRSNTTSTEPVCKVCGNKHLPACPPPPPPPTSTPTL
jgi:hypothetical protein